jgi:hypothetical protein
MGRRQAYTGNTRPSARRVAPRAGVSSRFARDVGGTLRAVAAEQTPATRRPRPHRAICVGAGLGIATLGAFTRPFGWAAIALIAGVAAIVLVAAVRRPTDPTPASPRLRNGLLLWSPLALAVAGWEVFVRSRQANWDVPDPSHPTLSTLLDPALEHGPGRWVGWLVWLAIGWWLLR